MKFVNYSSLTKKEKGLINKTIKTSEKSISATNRKVGCVILCENGDEFVGSTIERTKVIGSTCAERMAVDQLYFSNNKKPCLVVLAGKFDRRKKWTENIVCTPCGVCLEMFLVMTLAFGLKDLNFLCSSWNKSKILKAKLTELFPHPCPLEFYQ